MKVVVCGCWKHKDRSISLTLLRLKYLPDGQVDPSIKIPPINLSVFTSIARRLVKDSLDTKIVLHFHRLLFLKKLFVLILRIFAQFVPRLFSVDWTTRASFPKAWSIGKLLLPLTFFIANFNKQINHFLNIFYIYSYFLFIICRHFISFLNFFEVFFVISYWFSANEFRLSRQ